MRVAPASIDYLDIDGKLMARSKDSQFILNKPTTIIYSYSLAAPPIAETGQI